jgi:hypothetical protein
MRELHHWLGEGAGLRSSSSGEHVEAPLPGQVCTGMCPAKAGAEPVLTGFIGLEERVSRRQMRAQEQSPEC